MPYYIVRVLIRISFITYFRKLYFIDSQKVPKKAPIIFAANHPTAFLEPIMHAPYLDHVTYFILRGDYFESKWAKKVLSSLKIVPIFRQRDGMEKMRQNANLFGMFQDMLHEKKNLTIMVEGSHDHRKHLRKVQRGTARMALGTYKEYGDEDITILPMGVTFSDVQSVRSVAMIKFGEPIPLKDYLELYAQNERKAMLNITKDIQTRLRPCLVHLEDLEHYENTNFVLDMYRNTQQLDLWKPFSKNATHVEAEISLAERINQIPNIEALAHEVKTYQKQLQNVGVKDLGLGKQEQFNIATTLTLLLLLPIFSIITLVHSPLIALVHFLKNKMKKPEFQVSIGFVAFTFGYPILWAIWGLIAFVLSQVWLTAFVLAMPLLAFVSLIYWDNASYWNAARKFRRLQQTQQIELIRQRQKVLNMVN